MRIGNYRPWNKGLTKDTDARLKELSVRYSSSERYAGERNPAKKPEAREKIRLSKLGNTCGRFNKGLRKGIPLSEETKRKISLAGKGRVFSKEQCLHMSQGKMGHSFTDEGRRNLALGQRRRFERMEERERASINTLTHWGSLSEEERYMVVKPLLEHTKDWSNKPNADARRKAISDGNRRAWGMKLPEERREIARRAHKTRIDRGFYHLPQKRPNNVEVLLQQILDANFPNEWRYTGCGEVWIGIYCPDFTNINGKKALIELFGDYWHKDDNPEDKIGYYKQYGFNCLVIWEREIKNNLALPKIREFCSSI